LPLSAHHYHRSARHAVITALIEQEVTEIIKDGVSFGRDGRLWKVFSAPLRVQRAAHDVFAVDEDEETAVAAVPHGSGFFAQIEAATADDGGELRAPRQRHEAQAPRFAGVDVDAEEAGRVPRAESAEEGGVGGAPEPAPGDGGGADEGGGEVEAEEDLAEEVVVVKHRRGRGRRCSRRRFGGGLGALHMGFHWNHDRGFDRILERSRTGEEDPTRVWVWLLADWLRGQAGAGGEENERRGRTVAFFFFFFKAST